MRCENCDQLALENDTVCWHCGQQLPGREQKQEEKFQVNEGWQQPVSLSRLGAYSAITLIVIIAALLVTRSLGNMPLVQVDVGRRPPEGWERITDFETTFTVWLPETWAWFDATNPDQKRAFEEAVDGNVLIMSGTSPLGDEVEDVEVVFVARSPADQLEQAGFVVVGRSKTLNRLSYDDALLFLKNSPYQIRNSTFVDNFDKSHVSLDVETPVAADNTSSLRCRQQFVHGQEEGTLIATCAPVELYGNYTSDFETLLSSFQNFSPA